jgi:hypothetical protein
LECPCVDENIAFGIKLEIEFFSAGKVARVEQFNKCILLQEGVGGID